MRNPLIPQQRIPTTLPPRFITTATFMSTITLKSMLIKDLIPCFCGLFGTLVIRLLSSVCHGGDR